MYLCYICGHLNSTITKFRSHLLNHSRLAELHMPILCRQGNCKASFVKIYNLFRHIEAYHKSDNEVQCSPVGFQLQGLASDQLHDAISEADCSTVADVVDVQNAAHASTVHLSQNCMKDVHTEAVSVVAALRASSSIPVFLCAVFQFDIILHHICRTSVLRSFNHFFSFFFYQNLGVE